MFVTNLFGQTGWLVLNKLIKCMNTLIMTTGKEKTDTSKSKGKKVTFEDTVKDNNYLQDNGVYMQVRGRGLLMVRSSSLDENDEPYVEAFINLRNPPVPVVLFLPKNGEDVPEVFGDGDIQFTMKGVDNELLETQFGDFNQKNDNKSEVDSKDKNKYTHRRSNSDYLKVIGNDGPDNADTSIERMNKDNDGHKVDNKYEFDIISLEDGVILPSLKSPTVEDTLGFDTVDSSMAKLNQLSEETKQWSNEGKKSNLSTCTQDFDIDTESENELEENAFSKRNDSLPLYRKKWKKRQLNFRRTVKSSNKDIWREGKSLKSAIQHSYTYLLDILDISELCDHLYENSLLDIVMYQDLSKLSSEHENVRSAKRYLLMYLSTHTICHDKFVDSLYGSAQYQLVPLFYPGVNI
ncbi:hypothetical protein ACF0H5_019047 [Mactra antiquata]